MLYHIMPDLFGHLGGELRGGGPRRVASGSVFRGVVAPKGSKSGVGRKPYASYRRLRPIVVAHLCGLLPVAHRRGLLPVAHRRGLLPVAHHSGLDRQAGASVGAGGYRISAMT